MNIVTHDEEASWKLPVRRNSAGEVTAVLERVEDRSGEEMPVPVFSARLKYGGSHRRNTHSLRHLFMDEQTGMVLRFSPKTMEALVHGILSGELKVDPEAEVVEGLFTFQLYSSWVFATPLSALDRARIGL